MTTECIKNVTYASNDFTITLGTEQFDVIESDLINRGFKKTVDEHKTFSLVTFNKTVEENTTVYTFFLNKYF